jgi:hypothetical protein
LAERYWFTKYQKLLTSFTSETMRGPFRDPRKAVAFISSLSKFGKEKSAESYPIAFGRSRVITRETKRRGALTSRDGPSGV